jgi:short-subunit dehydrogenase
MIQLHVSTLYHLTRLFLRDMIERDRGHIINLSSISALQPSPLLATYAATKSFVLQFSRAINYELKEYDSRVRVTAVCPMATAGTGFQAAAGMLQTNTFETWMTTTPDVVARDIYAALKNKKDFVIPGRGFGLLQRFVRHLPDSVQMRIARKNLQRK